MTRGFKLQIADQLVDSAALGTLVPTIGGMPAANLQALYLLQDGTIGSQPPSSIADSSGNGNNGSFFGGAANCVRSTYGFSTISSLSDGFAIQTPIPYSSTKSIVFLARQTVGEGATGQGFPTWYGSTAGLNATWTGTQSHNPSVRCNVNIDGPSPSTGFAPGLVAPNTSLIFAGGTKASVRTVATGKSEQTWHAFAFSIQSDGTLNMRTGAGNYSEVSLAAALYIDDCVGNFWFGVAKNGTQAVKGDIVAAAIYNAQLSAADLDAARYAMIAIAAGRGIAAV